MMVERPKGPLRPEPSMDRGQQRLKDLGAKTVGGARESVQTSMGVGFTSPNDNEVHFPGQGSITKDALAEYQERVESKE